MKNLAWLLAPLLLLGAAPAEDAPTGWGCSADTLVSGDRCVFEGDEHAAASERADQVVSGLADTACSLHLKPDEKSPATDAVAARCKAEMVRVAKDSCAGNKALLDAQGRFLPSAKGCYRALTEARQHAEWQASTLAPCCACLAAQHCVAAAGQCVESAATSAQVEASNPRCALSSCSNACVGLLPEEGAAERKAPPTRVSHR